MAKCDLCGKEIADTVSYTRGATTFQICKDCDEKVRIEDYRKKIQPAVETICNTLINGDMQYIVEAFFQSIQQEPSFAGSLFFTMLDKVRNRLNFPWIK